MSTIYQDKQALTLSLGSALKQTFDDVQNLRKELLATRQEIILLKMKEETLRDENIVLRERNEGFEESLEDARLKQSVTLQEFKESHKQETVRVAKVLRRTLQAFKRSKNSLDKLQNEYEKLKILHFKKSDYINDLHVLLADCKKNIDELHQDRIAILNLLLSPSSPKAEQKVLALEASLNTLKEKAKIAILQKEDEIKRQKAINQELEQNVSQLQESKARLIKDDEHIKLRLQQTAKKLDETLVSIKNQQEDFRLLKSSIEVKQEEITLLKDSEEALKKANTDLQERLHLLEERLHQNETELSSMHIMKSEYERMHLLFSNIKACMGGQIQEPESKPAVAADLFSLPKSKNVSMQQELF